MPNYTFKCPKCEHVYDMEMLHKAYKEYKPICPMCKCKAKRDFSRLCVYGFVEGRTVGSVADRNTDRMSNDELKYRTDELPYSKAEEVNRKALMEGLQKQKNKKK